MVRLAVSNQDSTKPLGGEFKVCVVRRSLTYSDRPLPNRERPQELAWRRPIFPGPCAQVSSALAGLTTVFGMGTGGPPPVWSPGNWRLDMSSKM